MMQSKNNNKVIDFQDSDEYKDAEELYKYRKELVKLEVEYEKLDLTRKILLDSLTLQYKSLAGKSILECEKMARVDLKYKTHIDNIVDVKLKKGLAYAKVESLQYKIKARTSLNIQYMHDNKMNFEFGGGLGDKND